MISYMSIGKAILIHLIAELIKKHVINILYKMSQYFSKPYECFRGNIKAELHMYNYATETSLKGATGVNTSNLATKFDLTSLKVDKTDIDKLKNFPC